MNGRHVFRTYKRIGPWRRKEVTHPVQKVPHQPRQVSREKFSSNLWEEISHCMFRMSFTALPASCVQRNVAESISLSYILGFLLSPPPHTKPLHWKTEINWLCYLLQRPQLHLPVPKEWFQCRPLMPLDNLVCNRTGKENCVAYMAILHLEASPSFRSSFYFQLGNRTCRLASISTSS